MNDGASPIYLGCQNRFDSTVQPLLKNKEEVVYLCQNNDETNRQTDKQTTGKRDTHRERDRDSKRERET